MDTIDLRVLNDQMFYPSEHSRPEQARYLFQFYFPRDMKRLKLKREQALDWMEEERVEHLVPHPRWYNLG